MKINSDYYEKNGKYVFPVPAGIRYVGDWTGFSLNLFKGPYIIDKQIPGCGFTEYCLNSNENVILCSPRKILLENKFEQHIEDVHYAKNENEPNLYVDKVINKVIKKGGGVDLKELTKEKPNDDAETIKSLETSLIDYCVKRYTERKPYKIIVTYDSFKYVKTILMNYDYSLFLSFKIVVDEFQSIFIDSRFKASTEFGFLNQLQSLSNDICFVSATPMIDSYLFQLDYFKNLPFIEFDWGDKDPGRVMKPELKVRKTKSILVEMKRIIQEYLDGKFAVLANPITGQIVRSTEAVFYVNSVNDILKVIKAMSLTPDQCNILCSKTSININRIKKRIGARFTIGSVPLKGEKHKMFTFCTRTVYLGADFYSTCARTFIFSDANIDSLAVDISLDLPQILGRQRLVENPWKNHAEFYFKTLGAGKEVDKAQFTQRLNEKLEITKKLLSGFSSIEETSKEAYVSKLLKDIYNSNYVDDYVSINNTVPVMNNLVFISEQRAYDIQQIDYKDRFTVFSTIQSNSSFSMEKMSQFIKYLQDTTIPNNLRLKELCETTDFTEDEKKIIASQASEQFDRYYNILGPKRCKAKGYNSTDLRKELQNRLAKEAVDIKAEIIKLFEVGKRYSNAEIKNSLGELYDRLGILKTPKTTDLKEVFSIKAVQIFPPTGPKLNGLEILGVL